MKIIISGHHLELGSSLSSYIETSLSEVTSKYFEHAVSGNVSITKDHQQIQARILLNEGTGTGVLIKANAEHADAYIAFDKALHKVQTQLAKYKERIKNHHKPHKKDLADLQASKYVLSPYEAADAEHNPIIVAEKSTAIEMLSVADAVMKMDLLDLPTLLFINESSGKVSVVYYRKDGNISWIDTPIIPSIMHN